MKWIPGHPGTTGVATTWPTSWLGMRVRTTTKAWPSTRRRLRVTNPLRLLAQTKQRIACTAATRRKPNIVTFTFHKQQDRTTRTVRFLHDLPPTKYKQHKDICQALIHYLQKMEIVELMIDIETSTGHNFGPKSETQPKTNECDSRYE